MNLDDLKYNYPDSLIAKEPMRPSRVMWVNNGEPQEISINTLIEKIPSGDILVINDTKVLKRRIFSEENFEILFLEKIEPKRWKVLFPASRLKKNQEKNQKLILPEGISLDLIENGLPQTVELSEEIDESYFIKNGEYPLPPYIQKARDQRHNVNEDEKWYQTAWAQNGGSQAAPTASLHFSTSDIEMLQNKGVHVLKITLHVGIGTFLPIKVRELSSHKMHDEFVSVQKNVWGQIQEAPKKNQKVWALGTTVTRTLESLAVNKISQNAEGDFVGPTDIFIYGDFKFKVVDHLLTNFHQPETTLLALVGAFAGLDNVKKNYEWAIAKNFRLFSYGDLTVWSRTHLINASTLLAALSSVLT